MGIEIMSLAVASFHRKASKGSKLEKANLLLCLVHRSFCRVVIDITLILYFIHEIIVICDHVDHHKRRPDSSTYEIWKFR